MFCTHYDIPFWPTRRTARVSTVVMTIAALIVFVWAMTGCGASPARQAFIGVETANSLLKGIPVAYHAGLISQEEVAYVQPYAHIVGKAADTVDHAILDKNVNLEMYRKALNDAVIDLLNKQTEAKKLFGAPATQPASTQPH